jgi:hypothetical protein
MQVRRPWRGSIGEENAMLRRFWLGILAYTLTTFPLGYSWHLVIFASRYEALEVYRDDVIIPFGLLAILVQGAVFSWLYGKAFAPRAVSWLKSGLAFGALAGVLGWTYMAVAVAAKHVMASVPDFLMLETGFVVIQFAIAGPLIGFAYRGAREQD